jgi:hypothetical protein
MEGPVSFVVFDRAVVPDMRAVIEAIRTRHRDASVQLSTGAGRDARTSIIHCNGLLVVVITVAAPLPQDDAIVRRSAATWPEAKTLFERQRTHLIVSVMGTSEQPLPAARVLTAVIGGLVATVPGCLGVVWDGKVANSAERWLEMSQRAFASYPDFPLLLWIGIQSFQQGATIGAITTGLALFVGREIEFEALGGMRKNVHKVLGLAAYLIEHGDVVKEGHTFGVDEMDRIQVRYVTSRRFPGLPVLLATAQAG